MPTTTMMMPAKPIHPVHALPIEESLLATCPSFAPRWLLGEGLHGTPRGQYDTHWTTESSRRRCVAVWLAAWTGREDVGTLDETDLDRALDRLAARRGAELPVGTDRLRLHRVARDLEVLGDLPEGKMRRQERQQPELRGCELLSALARVEAVAEL